MSRVHPAFAAALVVALLALASPTRGQPAAEAAVRESESGPPGAAERAPRFRAPDGSFSALMDEEAVLAFLRTAPIVADRPIGKGVSNARQVVLRRGEIEARAAFHDIDAKQSLGRMGGRPVPFFVDSYRSQIAAYDLSRLMGLGRVPPTVERRYRARRGSLHFWIEGGTDLEDVLAGERPEIETPMQDRQLADVWVFDALIRNMDRNQGNLVFDAEGRLWWIDHTRSFGAGKDLVELERVKRCSRRMWEALRALDADEVREALGPTLSRGEIKALMTRRERLVAHLAARIARLGEEAVIFDELSD